MRKVNRGFKLSYDELGRDRVCEILDVKEITCFKLLSGEINLKLDYAAKLFDNTSRKVTWSNFREWE